MKKNMGNADRIIRVIIAAVIAGLYFTGVIVGVWAVALLAISVVFVLTSFLSFCPLYALFGIKTFKTSKGQRVGS